MKPSKLNHKGFTLIASLLLLLLLSGIAIGLMMMVNTEGKVGSTDLQNNAAFHSAEGGIEKMTSDLAATFNNSQSPTAAQICNLSTMQPSLPGVTWKYYQVTPGNLGASCPGTLLGLTNWGQISSGQNKDLWAQIIPINMQATADEPGGQEVSMIRSAQVALIPVFQFGVFSDSDLGFFDSPNLNFAGRVHTNGDLYLGVAAGNTLTFHDKMEAYGNVVTEVLPNGLDAAAYSDTGNVFIPNKANGCTSISPLSSDCVLKTTNGDSTYGDGSVVGAGGNPALSAANTAYWNNFSTNTTNTMIINGNYGSTTVPGTGAKSLSMPFVNGTTQSYEIIRRAQATDLTALSQSREYNMAQIHVLFNDNPAELPGGASDANNVRLANVTGVSASNPYGIPTSVPTGLPALPANTTFNMYFAQASNAIPNESPCNNTNCGPGNNYLSLTPDWTYAPSTPASAAQTLVPTGAPLVSGSNTAAPPTINLCPPGNVASPPSGCATSGIPPYPYTSVQGGTTSTWNLIDGYLRVEYKDATGNWHPVTMEWLKLGFARGLQPPTTAGGNVVNPNAILILQQPADRGANGTIDPNGLPPTCNAVNGGGTCTAWTNPLPPEVLEDSFGVTPWQFGETSASTATQSLTRFNWYPINFYDAREGEPRDTTYTGGQANSCTTNGVMNAVEIDVGNLKRWLSGAIGTSGTSVDYVAQNGYVLYFSDERGMLTNPTKGYKTGDSGLEDVINSASAAGTPDGVLEPKPPGRSIYPEDVNLNGVLDEYGTANLGLGQYGANGVPNQSQNAAIVAATPDNPYTPRITSCGTTARKNWVSGARHVLKLVDGTLGNVPLRTDAAAPNTGGFTVASENPVYIQGDYNSYPNDTFFTQANAAGPGPDPALHSAAAVIADAVTVLSNSWNDNNSMLGTPTQAFGNRTASTTYYRVAIAGGKNMSFPFPSWENSTDYGFGTDGGVHNFLRFLEDWNSSGATLNYGGSLVSLYYATYNTGVFKCCNYSVYIPPIRNYIFDSDFKTPSGLPPGTPLFKDVNSLGYRQLFSARTN